jgi:hypothetical protein
MTPTVAALLVFLSVGVGATAWLRRAPTTPNVARTRGLADLAELRWRDFTRLVLQAMKARGYTPLLEDGASQDGIPSDGADIVLQGNHRRVLLSCKYGSASMVGAPAIVGLGKVAQLRGAAGIILATPGGFDDEAIRIARQQGNVELLDGADLWPELRPYVETPVDEAPQPGPQPAPGRPPRALALAWGAAALLGALAWLLVPSAPPTPAGSTSPVAAAPAADRTPGATPASVPVAGPQVAAAADADVVPSDVAALERRRTETASAVSTLFGVDRALWATQSTLLVYLATENADPMAALCPLLERYPELAASRVQLQPPQGSERPVRFRQCRAY